MSLLKMSLSGVKMEGDKKFSAVPSGIYNTKITETEVKATKAGTGSYILIVHEIIDGQYKGSCVGDNLNIQNQNEKAVEIGMARLVRYRFLQGQSIEFIEDSDELVGCSYKVEIEEEVNAEGQKNCRIKKLISKLDGEVSAPSAANTTQAPTAPERKLPWKK